VVPSLSATAVEQSGACWVPESTRMLTSWNFVGAAVSPSSAVARIKPVCSAGDHGALIIVGGAHAARGVGSGSDVDALVNKAPFARWGGLSTGPWSTNR
jgi:hypothetical protein